MSKSNAKLKIDPDLVEALIRLMENETNHGNNLESQRSSLTSYFISITTAIAAFVIEKKFILYTISLSFILVIIGAYGVLVTAKFSQRYHLHYARSKKWREMIYELYPNIDFKTKLHQAEVINKKRFPLLTGNKEKFELFYLWIFLYFFIFLLGLTFCGYTIYISREVSYIKCVINFIKSFTF